MRLARCLTMFLFAVCSAVISGATYAQGLLVDQRPHIPIARSYEVREVSVDARIREQAADVQVSQTFYNPGNTQLEVEYVFPMPDDGAIQNFVLMVDGRELPGKILAKDEARRIYENIVRTKRDPALLEYMGRGMFRTSVFPVPPNAERRVTLRYTQLCRRDRDVVEFVYPFSTQKFTAKPIQQLNLTVHIDSRDPIKSIYCASHDARVDRRSDREAVIKVHERGVVPNADFRVVYTLADGAFGANVLSYRPSEGDDGYFLLLISPQVKAPDAKPMPKSVVFVLDKSGSMNGQKIEQARGALKFVLNNLRDGDTFNVVTYDDRVESFKPELQRYDDKSRAEALRFVDNIRAGGSTNMDAALASALAMMQDEKQPSYVLFLTDGLPTAGEQRELAIAENVKRQNKSRARVFSFGVGFDVNARLLDRLSAANAGISEYVLPDQNIEATVSRFYTKLTSPALTDIRIEFAGIDLNRTFPRAIPDLFDGGQIVWVGRYRQAGRAAIRITGRVGNETRSFDAMADLAPSGVGSRYEFVERLWAVRRVGDIIDQIDLQGPNSELSAELVELSKRYGILTPYTAFLADETVDIHRRVEVERRALDAFTRLEAVGGEQGVAQREFKQMLKLAERQDSLREGESLGRALPAAPAGGAGGGLGGRAGSPTPAAAKARAGGATLGAPTASVTGANEPTVRRVGTKTFFRRNSVWYDSEVTKDEESKVVVIEQFSEKFFGLAANQSAELNQYLTFGDAAVVKLQGQIYRIEPAKK